MTDKHTPDYIDIVFAGPPGHEACRFVEVEDASGRSFSFGTWIERPDKYWSLRIPSPDAELLTLAAHYHVAGTTVGLDIDKCAKCGLDLRHVVHSHAALDAADQKRATHLAAIAKAIEAAS